MAAADVIVPVPMKEVEKETKKGEDILSALDDAKISWFHFKAVIIAGMGFFTDAYDLYCIGLMTGLISDIYYNGSMPLNIKSALNGVALCGTLAGQLFFGWAGDKFGRKAVYGATLWLMIIMAIGQACSFGRSTDAVIASLCVFRFFLGFGVGGDYPLSATIMSEYSSKSSRGAFVAAVFAMQGVGYLVAATVALIVTGIFSRFYPQSAENADFVWRIVLAFACVPTALTLYARNKMPETARFTMLVANDTTTALADMEGVLQRRLVASAATTAAAQQAPQQGGFKAFLKGHWKHLVGTTMTWFLLDVAFYSQGLFQSDVFRTVGWVPSKYHVQGVQAQQKVWLAYSSNPFGSGTPGLGFPSEDPLKVGSNHFVANTGTVGKQTWDLYYPTATSSIPPYWNEAAWGKPPENLHVTPVQVAGQEGGVKNWWTPVEACWYNARAQAIIALGSTIPGYWVTVFTIERIGRWWIQMFGFFFMTLFMGVIAGAYNSFVETPVDRPDLLARSCFFTASGARAYGNAGGYPAVVPSGVQLSDAYVRGADGLYTVNSARLDLFKAEGMEYEFGKNAAGAAFTAADVKKCVDWRQFVKYAGNPSGFIVLYALTFFFANWGPNSTTFVVPAEIFPSRWRSTAHGISAAMGKLGAIIGAFGFVYAASEPNSPDCHNPKDPFQLHDNPGNPDCGTGLGLRAALGILAITNFIGMLFTFLVPESKGMSLEQLGGEVAGRVGPELGSSAEHVIAVAEREDAKPHPAPVAAILADS